MEKEERKEEQVPEVGAAWQKLLECSEILREAIEGRDRLAVKSDARQFQRWFDVLGAKDSVAAFREEMRQDLAPWLDLAETAVGEGNIAKAIDHIWGAERELTNYARLLGHEVPPRAAEEVEGGTAEVEAVEEPAGTPLAELRLSTRVYNALCRSKAIVRPLGLVTVDSEGYEVRKRDLYVEEILSILEARGETFLLGREVRDFGPLSLEELKTALREGGFLPAEEGPNTEWTEYDEAVY